MGEVGCGKTSLLYSILGETSVVGGKKNICGKIAYVEQEPFIFSGTILDNILFGLDYDEDYMEQVITVC